MRWFHPNNSLLNLNIIIPVLQDSLALTIRYFSIVLPTAPTSGHLSNLLYSFLHHPSSSSLPFWVTQPNPQYKSFSPYDAKGPVYLRSYYLELQEHPCKLVTQTQLTQMGFCSMTGSFPRKLLWPKIFSSSTTHVNARNKTIHFHTDKSNRQS